NKMDRMGARFPWVVANIREKLKINPIPVQLPIGKEDAFEGVVDLVTMKAYSFDRESLGAHVTEMAIPDHLSDAAAEARTHMLEAVAELDEEILDDYLGNRDISAERLKAAIRRITLGHLGVPVFCGTALHNKGIQPLMNAILDYLPSPLDVPPVRGHDLKSGAEVVRQASDFEPLSALAFKIANDPYFGKLVFVRVYSGCLKKGQAMFNPRTRKRERLMRLMQVHANQREDVDVLYAGEIGAAVGLKAASTGDTLCTEQSPILLERISFPEPVISMAIEPKSQGDKDKLTQSLAILSDEDPTFRVNMDPDTGQTLISGMGELHLEIIRDRMMREFHVKANAGKPMVAYRETIEQPASATSVFDRELGSDRHYAAVEIELKPRPRQSGNEVFIKARPDEIPKEFHDSVLEGIESGLLTGFLANYPLIDVEVCVKHGAFRPEDSTDVAFRSAAMMALREAISQANPVILEPIIAMEVIVPEEHLGDVLGDLNSRRGRIKEMAAQDDAQIIHADVPLAELFGYATALRSLSRGRASSSM
ncbi:MAG: elongation factor G, partial [Kiritimatiellae bacterium]|nr:elongation factor G [Kiritimatiellia bacterium]